jgi:hypothetical protein
MEDLALIVSLMLFIPIVLGLATITFSIVQRSKPKLRVFAIVLASILGAVTLLALIQYPPLGAVPLFEVVISAVFLFVKSRKAIVIFAYIILGLVAAAVLLMVIQEIVSRLTAVAVS